MIHTIMIFLHVDLNTAACTKTICNSRWENSLPLILPVRSLLTFKALVYLLTLPGKQRIWIMNNFPSKVHHSTMTGFDSNERLLLIIPWPKLEWRDSGTSSQVTIFCHNNEWLTPVHSDVVHLTVHFWRACASFMTNEALYNIIYRFCVHINAYKWCIMELL